MIYLNTFKTPKLVGVEETLLSATKLANSTLEHVPHNKLPRTKTEA